MKTIYYSPVTIGEEIIHMVSLNKETWLPCSRAPLFEEYDHLQELFTEYENPAVSTREDGTKTLTTRMTCGIGLIYRFGGEIQEIQEYL